MYYTEVSVGLKLMSVPVDAMNTGHLRICSFVKMTSRQQYLGINNDVVAGRKEHASIVML